MNLKIIGANVFVLQLKKGLEILFSYGTPVACKWINDSGSPYYYQTESKHSPTTSRHIASWVQPDVTDYKPQSYFDALAEVI